MNDQTSSRLPLRLLRAGVATAAIAFFAQPAAAQELSHRFVNPSFGGNPFYSEHLLAIANIHRPAQPEDPAEDPPTEEELLAAQLRSQFLAQLSADIRQRILTAQDGATGSFDLGTTRISFVRRGNSIEITFLDTGTGQESRIVIPATTDPFSAAPIRSASGEQSLQSANVGALSAGGQLTAPNVGRLVPSMSANAGAADADSRLLATPPGL